MSGFEVIRNFQDFLSMLKFLHQVLKPHAPHRYAAIVKRQWSERVK